MRRSPATGACRPAIEWALTDAARPAPAGAGVRLVPGSVERGRVRATGRAARAGHRGGARVLRHRRGAFARAGRRGAGRARAAALAERELRSIVRGLVARQDRRRASRAGTRRSPPNAPTICSNCSMPCATTSTSICARPPRDVPGSAHDARAEPLSGAVSGAGEANTASRLSRAAASRTCARRRSPARPGWPWWPTTPTRARTNSCKAG